MSDKEFEKMMAFHKVARTACKKAGKVYEFVCPICGGKAKVCKSGYNGHHHAHCETCKNGFME